MKVSIFLQFAAFILAVISPIILLLAGYGWLDIVIYTAYPWLIGIVAAIWDYLAWRRGL